VLGWKFKYREENEVLPPHWVKSRFTRFQHGTSTANNTTLTTTTFLSMHVIARSVHSPTYFFTLLAVYKYEHSPKKNCNQLFSLFYISGDESPLSFESLLTLKTRNIDAPLKDHKSFLDECIESNVDCDLCGGFLSRRSQKILLHASWLLTYLS
jgi:hypothetical protein